MLKAESKNIMVRGADGGRGLIGHWTLKTKSPARKHIVSAGSGQSPVDPMGAQSLIWVWSLRSEFVV